MRWAVSLAGQRGLDLIVHGQKLGVLEFLVAHGRAAEGERVEIGDAVGAEIAALHQVGGAARCAHALRHQIRHGLGVARAAPVHHCYFAHLHILSFVREASVLCRTADALRVSAPAVRREYGKGAFRRWRSLLVAFACLRAFALAAAGYPAAANASWAGKFSSRAARQSMGTPSSNRSS